MRLRNNPILGPSIRLDRVRRSRIRQLGQAVSRPPWKGWALYPMGIRAIVSCGTLADTRERRDRGIYADLAQALIDITCKFLGLPRYRTRWIAHYAPGSAL